MQASYSAKADRITGAALDAIYEHGLDQVKLTDVARKAGVTTGAVTYYFEDKDALLKAAFRKVSDDLFDGMREYRGGWKIERFTNSLPTNRQRKMQWSVWLAFCARAQASHDMAAIYREFYHSVELAVAGISGFEKKETAREAAGQVIAAMDGIGLCATLHPKLWPAARQRKAIVELIGHLFVEDES